MSAPCFPPPRRRPHWILLPLLLALTAQWLAAATFPLPIPTRPTAFPLKGPTNQGVIIEWGANRAAPGATSSVPAGLTGVVAISEGSYHSVALLANGTVVAFGKNSDDAGQTNVPPGLSNVVAIAAGYYHSVALKRDGTVVAWGSPAAGRTAVPPSLTGVVGIAAGYTHNLALKWDGTVVGWGSQGFGEATPPTGLSNVVAIAVGMHHSLALKNDGRVIAWGRNADDESMVPVWLNDAVAIAAGSDFSLALRSNGSVIHWGFDAQGQLSPPDTLGEALAISATFSHSLALRSDLSVIAWGQHDCCSGATSVPVGLRNVLSVAAGTLHSLALIHPLPPSPRAAATAQVVNGFLVGVNVTAPGSGYTTPPAVQIEGGGGTGAVLVPVMDNGRVVSLTVENPGRGYTSAPQITIAPPPLPPPSLSVAVSRVIVRQQVTPGLTYRLESSPDLQTWSPVGEPFVAESEQEQHEITVTDGALHFRLVEVP